MYSVRKSVSILVVFILCMMCLISCSPTENVNQIVREVQEELENKGWKNVMVVEGIVDSREWNVILERTEEEKNMRIHTIHGEIDGMYDNPIHAVIEVVFGDDAPDGEIYDVFYVSDSGRVLEREEIPAADEILDADNPQLWVYMYSY